MRFSLYFFYRVMTTKNWRQSVALDLDYLITWGCGGKFVTMEKKEEEKKWKGDDKQRQRVES